MLSVWDVDKIRYPSGCGDGYGGDEPVTTLRVDVYDDDDGKNAVDGKFSAIVDDIQSILIFPLNANNGYRDGELNNVAVEVVSPRDCFQPSIFPIPPDDPTVAIYRLVRDEETDATIVVIVSPGTVCDWGRLGEKIMNGYLACAAAKTPRDT